MNEGLRFRSGRKGYKQGDRGLPTVADGELMLEGWSIVSSKEGREERNRSLPSSPCCSSPCYWGLNLGRRKGERACVHVGESLPPGLPASQNSPPPPLLLRHLILFPATQLYAKSGQEALGSRNNLTQK